MLVLFSFVYAAPVTHDENGHSENIQRSTSSIQRRSQSSAAAIFINSLGCKLWRSRFKLGVGSITLPHCRRRYRDESEVRTARAWTGVVGRNASLCCHKIVTLLGDQDLENFS